MKIKIKIYMATYRTFEELDVWQKARAFASHVYAATKQGAFAREFDLKDQINRSSGSIMDNIAEGFKRGGSKEFIMFLSYAKGSAGEARSQIYRAFDREIINEEFFRALNHEALGISKSLSGFIAYLKRSPITGPKFHEPDIAYDSAEGPDNFDA